MFDFAWLLFAFPAAGVLVNLLAGHRLGRRAIGYVGTGAVIASFAVAVGLFASLLSLPPDQRVITELLWEWITVGDFTVNAAMLIDPLSITMALVVTGVGALIHIYSISYMADDPRFQRFFIYLNFFILAMLILVMSDSFLGMFVGWEGVGLASYLLIGFWFDRRDSTYGWYADAGVKAFLVNRVGDFGMIVAMLILWTTLGSLTFLEVFERAHEGLAVGAATIICLLLLLGATGKSAQIPLFVWLPDAMAGPTPVSALIHAATMVTAGVYMIARTNALWHIATPAATTAAWIGALTAFFAATVALVQVELKKILAYSTISQLGFMILGVGVGAYGGAIFHLITHAFFKALLFLDAGSVMHGLHGETDIRKMGGLKEKMPATFRTFIIGAAALAGLPLMSGYFSKDAILLGALVKNPVLYTIGLITALLTAFYSFRAVYVTFYGEPRDKRLYDHAHESPPLMTGPLWVLAALSILGGLINLPFILTLEHFEEPSLGIHEEPLLTLELFALTASVIVGVFGVLMAFAHYRRHEPWVERIAQPFRGLEPVLKHAWYVDDFYKAAIVQPLRNIAAWFARTVDQQAIDGLVNGLARGSQNLGERLRYLQTGVAPIYALSIFIGVVALLVYFVLAA